MTAFGSVTVLSQAWQPQSYDATRFLSFERKTPVLRTNPGRRHLFVLRSQTQCLLIWPTGVLPMSKAGASPQKTKHVCVSLPNKVHLAFWPCVSIPSWEQSVMQIEPRARARVPPSSDRSRRSISVRGYQRLLWFPGSAGAQFLLPRSKVRGKFWARSAMQRSPDPKLGDPWYQFGPRILCK